MDLNLYFSESEKLAFLHNRGWNVYSKTVPDERHLHGSKFITYEVLVWYARKGDDDLEIDRAFVKELKHKLIFE